MIIAREIAELGRIPRGYGIAYWHYDRAEAVAYPMPLNVLVCWLRLAFIWLRFPPGRAGRHALRVAFRRQRQKGWCEGYIAGANSARLRR